MARPTTQAISLEKFRSTDRSVKTVKLFHLEKFATYGIFVIYNVQYFKQVAI